MLFCLFRMSPSWWCVQDVTVLVVCLQDVTMLVCLSRMSPSWWCVQDVTMLVVCLQDVTCWCLFRTSPVAVSVQDVTMLVCLSRMSLCCCVCPGCHCPGGVPDQDVTVLVVSDQDVTVLVVVCPGCHCAGGGLSRMSPCWYVWPGCHRAGGVSVQDVTVLVVSLPMASLRCPRTAVMRTIFVGCPCGKHLVFQFPIHIPIDVLISGDVVDDNNISLLQNLPVREGSVTVVTIIKHRQLRVIYSCHWLTNIIFCF